MTGAPQTVHVALAKGLTAQGIDTLFGLLGDSNLFMADAFTHNEAGRFIPATNEDNAVLMALGFAAMTGKTAAVTVTQGPAVSNALTGLIEGVKAQLPIVFLCGDTSPTDPWHPQAVAQEALIVATGAGFERLKSPETACADLATAFRRASVERRPVAFNMPTAMMWEPTSDAPVAYPAPNQDGPAPDGPDMDNAIGIIASARRPVILAGRGAIPAREVLIRLADRIGAPLATTLKAKGLFQGHDFNLGVFGTLSTPAAGDVIASADCIISFGATLGRFTTMHGSYLTGSRLIQVDDDAGIIGRFAQPDAALVGTPGAVADRVLHWLDQADIPSSRATDTLSPTTLTTPEPAPPGNVANGTVELTAAMDAIEAALPADRLFVSDGGRFMGTAWKRLSVSHPRNFLLTIATGAIGMGLGYAIGAAQARPDQTTLLVAGDGGLMLGGLTEFSSAVRDKLNLVVVVCNDQAYGAEYVQFEDRQMDPSLSLFNWPSFAAMARSMGGHGETVASMEELHAALAALPDHNGPVLIELMLDPAAVPRLQL
ncbi:thiamine pyrophosphate-binding protein [Alisedimentitalea sp. MJ-SS2]|uniref:thiamine pyrophosphate-binding protein n=1 Tax=Aliisedimentitalea sp. MJ-SS2 TaxID=3049795 RepID=UPI00290E6A9D|nr:thiamine pyrophosphate-dependent enzyme [Alisedimentitalea sp. MJ-SS2]MDU8926127.1 thiamine pyrophosphate-binding protein [Alisedimentitalea sp. MJ-SS2]